MTQNNLLKRHSTEILVRALAQHAGLGVKFERKHQPRTDGKYIYLGEPKLDWDHKQQTIWEGACYHEIRHNLPKFKDAFEVLRENKIDIQSILGNILNCIEDYRIEHWDHKAYAGEFQSLQYMRKYVADDAELGDVAARLEKQLAEVDPGDIPEGFDKDKAIKHQYIKETLITWDYGLRESWSPVLRGISKDMAAKLDEPSWKWLQKLEAGDYGDILNQCPTSHEMVTLAKRIAEEVFELSEEEQQQSQSELEIEVAGEAVVKYKDLNFHDHSADERSGERYPITILYEQDDWRGEYTPYRLDEMKEVSKFGTPDQHTLFKIRQMGTGDNIDKHVLKMLQVASQAVWRGGQKRGRLSSKHLYRTGIKEGQAYRRVFKQKDQKILTDTSVCVLVDCSGSMHGSKFEHAAKAASMLASSIGALNVPYEVLGFTATYNGPKHFLFSTFGQRTLPQHLEERFASVAEDLHNNADGDSILWAVNRLAKQKTAKKVMFVLSDGQPAGGKGGNIAAFTKRVVDTIETATPIDIMGIGIMSSSVKDIYRKHVVINSAGELEPALLNLIKTKLLGG